MKAPTPPRATLSCKPAALILTVLLAALPLQPAGAFDPGVLKLHARNTALQSEPLAGSAVAVGETYVLVGEPNNDDDGPDAGTNADTDSGAVHVFNAATGAYVRKLRASDAAADDNFGYSVAVSGNLALVGAIHPISGTGSAYVFDLVTGKQLQKLTALVGQTGGQFGSSVALSGSRALVGASGDRGHIGAAYVFDAVNVPTPNPRTEKFKFTNPVGVTRAVFGKSVALSGNLALIGEPFADGVPSPTGAAYLFDAVTGQLLRKLSTPAGGVPDQFGYSVALSGNLALVGAPWEFGVIVSFGSVYVFDVVGGGSPRKLTAPYFISGDRFGASVALSDNLALIGAPDMIFEGNLNRGSAYVIEATSGIELRELTAANGSAPGNYGWSVALCANRAVIGAPHDNDLGQTAGAAYLIQPIAGPFPMETVAVLKNFAPGAPNTTFTTFGEAFIDTDGEVMFPATLAGSGAASGKNLGVWDTMGPGGNLNLLRRSGVDINPVVSTPAFPAGVKATGVFNPIINQPNFGIVQATLTGTGVTSANNRVLLGRDGGGFIVDYIKVLRLDDAPLGGGEKLMKFLQVVQPMFDARQAVAFQLRTGTGSTPVTASNDTGIVIVDNTGGLEGYVREGGVPFGPPSTLLADGAAYGQFSRVSHQHSTPIFTMAMQSLAAFNQALFKRHPSASPPDYILARKGFEAPDKDGNSMPGVKFSAFTGETTSFSEEAVFRATLAMSSSSAPPVTSLNDQGLWWEHSNLAQPSSPQLRLAVREGQQVDDQDIGPAIYPPTGVVWNSFPSFWGMDVVGIAPDPAIRGQILFLATLRGPGVTGINDRALCLLEENSPPSVRILLREGDPAPDCGRATIGTIQRVVASPHFAHYAVLVTLANAPATSNQALYRGTTVILPRTDLGPLRRPFLALRKGTFYDGGSAVTTLKSISLPATTLDATGAGGKGLGMAINAYGEMVLKVTFNDNAVHLVKGAP